MIQARKRLGLFALCATAALSSTSLLVSTAQAAPPNWDVGGAELVGLKQVTGTLGGEPNLLSNVLKHMIRISCTIMRPNVFIHAGGIVTATPEFENCRTFYGGAANDVHTAPVEALPELEACKPEEPIAAAGIGQLDLHIDKNLVGKHVVELEGLPFAIINLGPECPVGEQFEVKGKFFAEDVGGNVSFLEEKLTHTFREAVTATLELGALRFGANPAALDGTASMSLVSDEKWRGLPL